MISVFPGPDGREILATSEGDGGWTLEWRDTGMLIQHRMFSASEIIEALTDAVRISAEDKADRS